MFNWHENARLMTAVPFKELLREVREELEELGATEQEARSEISVEAKSYSGFGYDARISAELQPGDPNEYDLKVRYEISPNAMCILGLLFWPILLIVFLQGQSSSQKMRRDINEVLERIELKHGKRKPVARDDDDFDDDF
jgi:hypothetical protein